MLYFIEVISPSFEQKIDSINISLHHVSALTTEASDHSNLYIAIYTSQYWKTVTILPQSDLRFQTFHTRFFCDSAWAAYPRIIV